MSGKARAKDYFFELLAEEIPAWMIDPVLGQLRERLGEIFVRFTGNEPAEGQIVTGATVRRFFFSLRGLPERQPDRQEEIKGPPRRIAYDAKGEPTAALTGFLKKNKLTLASLGSSSPEDDYIRVMRTNQGRASAEFLAAEIPRIVESLRWPKSMRWKAGTSAYIRPVHSLISLLGDEVVPMTMLGIEAGRETEGHRILGRGRVAVSSFDDYKQKLREKKVVVDALERVGAMREASRRLAKEVGGTPANDAAIWEQWKYLTEWPGVVRAEFERQFLTLPREVLIMVMRVHQKQLPILKDDELTSFFLAVMDNQADPDGNAASGNAFVTNARFTDARFFYETDRRGKLASRIGDLAHLQFQEKLGNYQEKTRRIETLVSAVCREVKADSAAAKAAASLCKCDLSTEMVKEFTDLQGQIGGIYAREEGEPLLVWQAVYDHYRPLNLEGELPRTIEGAIVSVADKIDTLCGFFLIGMGPTGSKDPFGLRRAAQGVVQILLNRASWELQVGLDRLLELGIAGYHSDSPSVAITSLREFLDERVRTLLQHAMFGLAYDEVDAAMAGGFTSVTDLLDRAVAIRSIRSEARFISILDSAKRIANIVGTSRPSASALSRLEHPTEKRLASLAELVEDHIKELVDARKYQAALESFASLAPELEIFFRDVLVMVDDPELREARLALLARIGGLATRIGEVTRIVVDRSEYTAQGS